MNYNNQSELIKKSMILALVIIAGTATHLLADDTAGNTNVVVTVNGRKITAADLKLDFFTRQLSPQQGPQATDELIQTLIDRELVWQYLAKRKVKVDKILLEQRMDIVRKFVEKKGDELPAVLQKLGLNEAALEELLSHQIAWKTYVHSALTEKQIKEFWKQNKSHFDGTEVEASQIFLKLKADETPKETAKAILKLDDIKASVTRKESTFAEAAMKYSESPSGTTGGDLGSFEYYGRVAEAIAAAAFKTASGKVSQPFQSRYGLHLVHVRNRTEGDLSLEDARPEVVAVLAEQHWKDLVARLRKTARIQLMD